MKPEYELRILDIDVDAITKKLKALGAKKVAERNMRRYVFDFSGQGKTDFLRYLRLRDNGDSTTLAVKERKHDKIGGLKELEVDVGDFEKTYNILTRLGFEYEVYQENKRISYVLDGTEIEIDFWPRIPAYLEIEGKSAKQVKDMVKKLGFKLSDTTTLSTRKVYRKYGIELHDIKHLKF